MLSSHALLLYDCGSYLMNAYTAEQYLLTTCCIIAWNPEIKQLETVIPIYNHHHHHQHAQGSPGCFHFCKSADHSGLELVSGCRYTSTIWVHTCLGHLTGLFKFLGAGNRSSECPVDWSHGSHSIRLTLTKYRCASFFVSSQSGN